MRTALAFALLAGAACGDGATVATQPVDTLVQPEWVTGNAAAAVDETGHFRLAGAPSGEMQADRATALAAAYVRSFPRTAMWEEDRGGAVAPDRVVPCGAFHATSPYASVPSASRSLRLRLGSEWLVRLCDHGNQVISVVVSALATDVWLEDGQLRLADGGGGAFVSAGVPMRIPSIPMSAEEATRMVFGATEARVSEVPELVIRPNASSHLPLWRMRLERPVEARLERDGSVTRTSELYAGFGETWHSTRFFVAVDTLDEIRVRDAEHHGVEVRVPIRSGYAHHFEAVTVRR